MVYIKSGMTKTPNPNLLPSGLSDLLAPEADAEAQAIHSLMQVFKRFGYARVKPPLIEFEDSLLAPGPGAALARQTFRLMDPVSQRMMGLRADTTAQIARIANSRLAGEERPLRLSYAADVLRVNGSQIRPARQFAQVGCEMIGAKTPQGDAEVALISLFALNEIGIKNLTIDLTAPMPVPHLLDQFGISDVQKEKIISALANRDKEALNALDLSVVPFLTTLLEASGKAEDAFEKLGTKEFKASAQKDIEDLKSSYESLKEGLAAFDLNAQITVDFVEHRGLDYETGVSFSLYSKDVRGELGNGGRYSLQEDAKDESATGFTLYMDSLLPVLKNPETPETKTLPADASWEDVRTAQEDGFNVIRKI